MTSTETKPGVVPYVLSPDCDKHIEWLKNVFNAEEKEMFRTKKDKVMHCAMTMNGGYLYLADDSCTMEEEAPAPTPENSDPSGFFLHVELENPNIFWKKALANGAVVIGDLKQQYWGGVYGCLKDPFGYHWGVTKGGDCRKPGVVPYIVTADGECEKEIEWLTSAFGAEVKGKHMSDDNLVQHCVVEINGGHVYLSDQSCIPGPKQEKPNKPHRFLAHMDVPNTKPVWDTAIKNGAKTIVELKVQFWGDLYGTVEDTHGYQWSMTEVKSKTAQTRDIEGVLPYILSPDCTKHIEWVKNVFGGEVKEIYHTKSKKIMHCNIAMNGGRVLMCDLNCRNEDQVKTAGEPKGFMLHLNVADPDFIWKKAIANGASQVMELKKQFWGDYYGTFCDPFGYEWAIRKA